MLYYVNCDDDLRVRMVANCMASEVPGMTLVTGEKLVQDLVDVLSHRQQALPPPVKRGLLVLDLDYVLRYKTVVTEAVITDILVPLVKENKTVWLYGRDHRSIIAHPAFDPVRDSLKEYDLLAGII